MTRAQAQTVISEMVRRIVSGFDPEKVILFGSYARGTATRDSDVDLAVIFPRLRGRRRDKMVEIRVALYGMGIPKDVVVMTKKDLEQQKDVVGSIAHVVAKEGKILYARA